MKTLKWTLCGLAVVAFALSASVALCAEAAKDASKDAPKHAKGEGKGGLKGEYGLMASELNMTDAQKAQLESVVKEQDAKLAAWKAENGEKQKELQAKLEEARKAKDEAAIKSIKEQQKALTDAQHNLEADKAKAVDAVLTPEQREKWAAYKVYAGIVSSYTRAKVDLTEAQKAKIKEMSAAASKDIAATGEDKKAKEKVVKDLNAKIKAEVLTDEQRKALEQKPEPKAKGEGKAKKTEGGEKAAETAPAAK